ncbi:lysozyme inhibitor LprI family protein [Burkholderia guangdongensis]|uniref:lysozyme inhibitor LprI family protein n=1 Tax=Burkholderia guangdongensis TaxID=1792500 RepID=UPI0015CAA73B|nr:lysozyme inhibitor LprI family protein [Burkholderia guangdongensis]
MKFRHLLAALLIVSPLAHATSFDCKKASTYVEKTICSSPLLGKLDDALADNYRDMLATNLGDGPDNKSLKKEQRAWIAQRNKCTTEKCLVDLYRKRVDDVCDAPVVSGVHAACVQSSDIQ